MGKINLKLNTKCHKCGNMQPVSAGTQEKCKSCGTMIGAKTVRFSLNGIRLSTERFFKRIPY